jgi:WD40 repeat protein
MILKAFKAHDTKVVKAKYSPDRTMFVTASEDGDIFFFQIGVENLQRYEPLCLIQIPSSSPTKITDLRWDANSTKILVSCTNGKVYQFERPNPKDIDNHETYLMTSFPYREWKIKMMEFQMKKNQKKDPEEEEKKKRMRLRGELPKEEDEPEEDWDPEPIHSCIYHNDGTGSFIITSQGLFSGYYYICDFNSLRPLHAIPIPKTSLCRYLDYSPSGQFFLMGYDNGEVHLKHVDQPNKYMQIKMHDGQ